MGNRAGNYFNLRKRVAPPFTRSSGEGGLDAGFGPAWTQVVPLRVGTVGETVSESDKDILRFFIQTIIPLFKTL